MQYRKPIQTYFNEARKEEPYSQEQVRSLLKVMPAKRPLSRAGVVILFAGVVGVIGGAGILYMNHAVETLPAGHTSVQTGIQSGSIGPAEQHSASQETASTVLHHTTPSHALVNKKTEHVASTDTPPAQTITGISMLTLSADELAHLHVVNMTGGYELMIDERYATHDKTPEELYNLGYDTVSKSDIIRLKITVTGSTITSQVQPKENLLGQAYSRILPVAITSHIGRGRKASTTVFIAEHSPLMEDNKFLGRELLQMQNSLLKEDECVLPVHPLHSEEQSSLMSKLIPIHLHTDDGNNSSESTDIILWYVPTKEFAYALPERYGAALIRELDVIDGVANGCLPAQEGCRRLSERSFLNVCQTGTGAIMDFSVSPNPARGAALCKYALGTERQVSIGVYDLFGKLIKNITHGENRQSGEFITRLNFDGIHSGAYLLAISTDKGEQSVQRVIIE